MISVKVSGGEEIYTLETEEDIRVFEKTLRGVGSRAACLACGEVFIRNVTDQKCCPSLPGERVSKCRRSMPRGPRTYYPTPIGKEGALE